MEPTTRERLQAAGFNWSLVVQLLSIAAVILLAFQGQRSDLRSTREELGRTRADLAGISTDLATIRGSLPNAAVYDYKLSAVQGSIAQVAADLKLLEMQQQKLREELLRRNLIR